GGERGAGGVGGGGGESGGEEAAEGMADDRRRGQFQLVEQFAVIEDQVEPVVECVHRVRIAASGSWKLRRIDRMAVGKAGDECAVGGKPPRPVQVDERLTAAADLDLGLDSVLPKAEPAYLRGGHVDSPARF